MNIILLGAEVLGTHIAQILSNRHHDVTVVDPDIKKIEKIESRVDVQCVIGDFLSAETLQNAGCAEADLLISISNLDTENIIAASFAKKLGTKKVIAKIGNRILLDGWKKYYPSLFNIDLVLSPEQLSAHDIAKRIGTAGFFVPQSLSHSNVALQEWTIDEKSPLLKTPLKDIADLEGIIIPAIFRKNEILIPSGIDELEPKDQLFMVGAIDDIHEISKKLQAETSNNRTVFIFGGGEIGFALAKILENTRLTVKLADQNESTCKFLSTQLNKTLIFYGSCLEEDFLLQQNIQNVDIFIAVGDDEEDNLMASLIAKKLGVKSTIVLSDRPEYIEIMKQLGIDTITTPRLTTANALFQFMDSGPLKTLIILQENVAEAIEISVSEESPLISKTISESQFPKGMIIASIIRQGKVIVPRGDLQFFENDTVIIFTFIDHLPLIQKLFA